MANKKKNKKAKESKISEEAISEEAISEGVSEEDTLEFALKDENFTEDESRGEDELDAYMSGEEEIDADADADLDVDADASIDTDVSIEADAELAVGSEESELAAFESVEIEEVEALLENEIVSIIESLLFATDRPQSLALLKSAFQGTKVKTADIRSAIEKLQMEYANPIRGVTLEEVAGGYQIRTKADNRKFLQRTVKARPFRLSGPALEVLSIVAYKQPCTKAMVDEVRGVESGHLMRGLLDRGLLHFAGKSDLPGRPMFYETTRKFLEIFGLRNINELPTLNEIDQLIPDGIGEAPEEKQTLSELTGELSTEVMATTYSEGEEELMDISSELQAIHTSSEFFDNEKRRQKEKRDSERAQDIRERLAVGEEVDTKDQRWLVRYEVAQTAGDEPSVADAPTETPEQEVSTAAAEVNDEIIPPTECDVKNEPTPIDSV